MNVKTFTRSLSESTALYLVNGFLVGGGIPPVNTDSIKQVAIGGAIMYGSENYIMPILKPYLKFLGNSEISQAVGSALIYNVVSSTLIGGQPLRFDAGMLEGVIKNALILYGTNMVVTPQLEHVFAKIKN